ncbi:MAG TPA: FmdB family zinc ribbon protein [Gemmataceae bacterium]|nr:FmdB family zinc ribbon protein [Gemmataceae bacterium]
MPTYEYKCDACGHEFDELQSFSADPLTKCPKCKKKKLRRLFGTGASIIFKGSGFYETDYRSESYKSGAKAESEATKPAESKGESKDTSSSNGESKPAAKKPAKGKAGTTGKSD